MTKNQLADLIQSNSPLDRKASYDLAKVLHGALHLSAPPMKRAELASHTAAYIAQGGKITTALKTFQALQGSEPLRQSTKDIVKRMAVR